MSRKYLITGCNGQLGKALAQKYPDAAAYDKTKLNISDMASLNQIDWKKFDVIMNAAAYVNADESETVEGRRHTWEVNAQGPRNLAQIALEHNLQLIHFSSEYVFDGERSNHTEEEIFSPLSVYGNSKAAADMIISLLPNHHIIRTTWVIGDGHNFIKTMKRLADMRINPTVVDDQFGRPTFTSELVRAVDHILANKLAPGTYNVTNSGNVVSWADIAAMTFELAGHSRERVTYISTEEYRASKQPFAPRPRYSDLDMSKIRETGFVSQDYEPLVRAYIQDLEKVE